MTLLMDWAFEPTGRYLGMTKGMEATENDSTIDSNDVRAVMRGFQFFGSNFIAMSLGF